MATAREPEGEVMDGAEQREDDGSLPVDEPETTDAASVVDLTEPPQPARRFYANLADL